MARILHAYLVFYRISKNFKEIFVETKLIAEFTLETGNSSNMDPVTDVFFPLNLLIFGFLLNFVKFPLG